jgi:hypothetical protein
METINPNKVWYQESTNQVISLYYVIWEFVVLFNQPEPLFSTLEMTWHAFIHLGWMARPSTLETLHHLRISDIVWVLLLLLLLSLYFFKLSELCLLRIYIFPYRALSSWSSRKVLFFDLVLPLPPLGYSCSSNPNFFF